MTDYLRRINDAYDAAPTLVHYNGSYVDPALVALQSSGNAEQVDTKSKEYVDVFNAPDDYEFTLPEELPYKPNEIIVASHDELRVLLRAVANRFYGGNKKIANEQIGYHAGHEGEHMEYAKQYIDADRYLLSVCLFKLPPELITQNMLGDPVGMGATFTAIGGKVSKLDLAGANASPTELSPEDKYNVDALYGSLEKLAVKLEENGRPLPRSLPPDWRRPVVAPASPRTYVDLGSTSSHEGGDRGGGGSVVNAAAQIETAMSSLPADELQSLFEKCETALGILEAVATGSDSGSGVAAVISEIQAAIDKAQDSSEAIIIGKAHLRTYLAYLGISSTS